MFKIFGEVVLWAQTQEKCSEHLVKVCCLKGRKRVRENGAANLGQSTHSLHFLSSSRFNHTELRTTQFIIINHAVTHQQGKDSALIVTVWLSQYEPCTYVTNSLLLLWLQNNLLMVGGLSWVEQPKCTMSYVNGS